MDLTTAELVILGLIIERPSHGYDLERTVTERNIRQWADLAFSSIYYVLGKLESRNYVRSEQRDGAKSRRVYSATPTGRAAASEATVELLATPTPAVSPFIVALANADLIDDGQFQTLVGERRTALAQKIAVVRASSASQGELPRAAELVFSYSLAQLEAEHAWIAALSSGDLP